MIDMDARDTHFAPAGGTLFCVGFLFACTHILKHTAEPTGSLFSKKMGVCFVLFVVYRPSHTVVGLWFSYLFGFDCGYSVFCLSMSYDFRRVLILAQVWMTSSHAIR